MASNQRQKAGDHSEQYQAETIIKLDGISEERVHSIVDDQCSRAMQNCILESQLIVERRISEFKTELYGSIFSRPELISALQEPACVDSLTRAAKAATKTNEQWDEKLLAELLVKRFENPNNRHIATGVNRAIDVVDSLTKEELTGLTVYFAVNQYSPVSPIISTGFDVMEKIFSVIAVGELPSGDEWIDNLDILDALRTTQFTSLKPLVDYYFDALSGYTICGVPIGSEEEHLALQLLNEAGVPNDLLINHELNPGYRRPVLRNLDEANQLRIVNRANGQSTETNLNDEQVDAVHKVIDLCSSDERTDIIKSNLAAEIEKRPYFSKVSNWWASISSAPRITTVGKCLASANARRLDPTLPDIE